MALVRLIYCSTVNGIGDKEIEAILDKSRANNALDNITGALIYDGQHFLQCLEGARQSVSKRLLIISQDCRHRDVELIDFSVIKERRSEAANDFETRLGKYLSYIANTKRATTAASSRKFNLFWMPMFRHRPVLRAALPLALAWIFTQVDDPLVVFLD